MLENENENLGLDKVTDADAENVGERDVATDLSALSRGISPLIKEKTEHLEAVNIDEILALPDKEKPAAEEIAGLDKLTEQDLEHPETKYKTVDLSKLTSPKKKPDGETVLTVMPTADGIQKITENDVKGLSTTEKIKEYEAMPYVSKDDVKTFHEANVMVDVKPLTKQYCRGCNKAMTNLEIIHFKNRCFDCRKKEFDKMKSGLIARYVSLLILMAVIFAMSEIKNNSDNVKVVLAFNIVGIVFVCGISALLTLSILAKKVGQEMVSKDYMLICLMVIAASYVLYAFVAIAYVVAAVIAAVVCLYRDIKKYQTEKTLLALHERDVLKQKLDELHGEKSENTTKTA